MATRKSRRIKTAYKVVSRDLRARSTTAEQVVWDKVRGRKLGGYRFRRQHRLENFIVDFYCHEARLVVEIDGSIHDTPTQRSKDVYRDSMLTRSGYQVVRYRNKEVIQNIEMVLTSLTRRLDLLTGKEPVPTS